MRKSVLNKNQLQTLIILRSENYPYAKIASVLDVKPDTIKSICRRKNITPKNEAPRKNKAEQASLRVCKICGAPLGTDCKINKQFCSDRCRTIFQNERKRLQRLEAAKTPQESPENQPELTGLHGQGELSLEDRR